MNSVQKYTSSKGNQLKTLINDGKEWFKADYLGYEGASEQIASFIAKHSNIGDFTPYKMSVYKDEVDSRLFIGCSSINFLYDKPNAEIVTAKNLFLQYKGVDIYKETQNMSTKDRIKYFVDGIEEITGIQNYGSYLTKMLEFDAFVLNEDRHFNNIAFLYDSETEKFSLTPLFDNGAAFMSDISMDYKIGGNTRGMISKVKAKPFSTDFDKQVKAAESLYGRKLQIDKNIQIPFRTKESIIEHYGEEVLNRIEYTINHQKQKYSEFLIGLDKEKIMKEDFTRD